MLLCHSNKHMMSTEERLWHQFNKVLGQYQLIGEGDKILAGLSGGKDSLCLLEFLARRSHILKPRFTLEALHIRMTDVSYESNTDYLESFCHEHGVPLHIITTSFPTPQSERMSHGSPAGIQSPSKKPPCFLCSWQRRKQLFNMTQQLGCQKIALGHHQDDIIQTTLMNLTFQGHFSTMPAKLVMNKMPLTLIRPLCLCREADIRTYAESRHYQRQLKTCPYENTTNRTTAADLFARMEQLNPEARYCLWHALEADGKLVDEGKSPTLLNP